MWISACDTLVTLVRITEILRYCQPSEFGYNWIQDQHMWLIRVKKSHEGFRVSRDMSLLVQPSHLFLSSKSWGEPLSNKN